MTMILTEDEIMKKSSEYSEAHSKDPLQRTCLQQGYADGWADCQQLLQQTHVSGALPVDSAIKEIENLMERWHLARDNDDETLQGINDVLVNIGLLGWFNRQ